MIHRWEYNCLCVCSVFIVASNSELYKSHPGSEFGLSLIINIEQYEYLPGPASDAGIKVYVS